MSRLIYASTGWVAIASVVFLAYEREAHAATESAVSYGRIPASAYSVVAEVRAKPGKEAELRAATLPLISKVRAENGNLVYFLQEDRAAPGHFVFYEVFVSRQNFEAHNRSAHVQEWFEKLPALAEGGVELTRLEILAAR